MKKRLRELGIIVLGVLIALFAENLWAAQADRAKASEYLARVTAEIESNRAGLAQDHRWVDLACPSSRALLAHVRGEELEDDASALLLLAVAAVLNNTPFHATATYDDLVTTGSLGLIDEADVREAILDAYAQSSLVAPYRPVVDNQLRRMVTQAVPEPQIREINEECLIKGGQFSSLVEARACAAAAPFEDPEVSLRRLLANPGLDGAVAARVFSICQFSVHVTGMGTELESAAEVLVEALGGEAF